MAYEALEDLEILQMAEAMCDRFYDLTSTWRAFDRDTVGSQLVRAADSVGANIAESYGRFHYGEKLNFLYYARGSLNETKFWVRRAKRRKLWADETCDKAFEYLNDLGKKLNAYISDKRDRRNPAHSLPKQVSESAVSYTTNDLDLDYDTVWLQTPNDLIT